jgi:hypothetical protein
MILVSTSAFIFSSSAQAYFLVEPSIGYSTGTQLKYTVNNVNYVFNQSMIPFFLNLGFQSQGGFYVAATGEYGASGTLAGTTNASGVGTSSSDTFYNVAAGLKFGYRTHYWQVFAGYFPLDKMTISPNVNNPNSPWGFSGSSVEAGVGVYFSNNLGLIGKYDAVTYSSYTAAGSSSSTTISSSGGYTSLSDSRITVAVNFPFLF